MSEIFVQVRRLDSVAGVQRCPERLWGRQVVGSGAVSRLLQSGETSQRQTVGGCRREGTTSQLTLRCLSLDGINPLIRQKGVTRAALGVLARGCVCPAPRGCLPSSCLDRGGLRAPSPPPRAAHSPGSTGEGLVFMQVPRVVHSQPDQKPSP